MRNAFTLIELLIVVSIIGVLAVALAPSVTNGPAKARDTARISSIKDAIASVETFFLDSGTVALDGWGSACLSAFGAYYTKPPLPGILEYDQNVYISTHKCGNVTNGIYPIYKRLSDGYAIIVPLETKAKANSKYIFATYTNNSATTKATYASSKIVADPDTIGSGSTSAQYRTPYAYVFVR